jgi:hypothetical protein
MESCLLPARGRRKGVPLTRGTRLAARQKGRERERAGPSDQLGRAAAHRRRRGKMRWAGCCRWTARVQRERGCRVGWSAVGLARRVREQAGRERGWACRAKTERGRGFSFSFVFF